MARIESLHIYPVKSGGVITLPCSLVTPRGLLHDRYWLIVDDAGQFVTQRTHPQLARLQTRISSTGLELTYPGLGELLLPLEQSGADPALIPPLHKVRVWKQDMLAHDTGQQTADYVSKIVGFPARLMRATNETFPDGYPLLICTLESLAALNRHLPAALPMSRFRPNLVLSGIDAWREDDIQSLRIGADVWLRPTKACTRCVMTSIDQDSGTRGLSPLETLRKFRYDPALRGVTFGQNAAVVRGFGKEIRVGDEVVISWKPARTRAAAPELSPDL